jgi:hypothetical protein
MSLAKPGKPKPRKTKKKTIKKKGKGAPNGTIKAYSREVRRRLSEAGEGYRIGKDWASYIAFCEDKIGALECEMVKDKKGEPIVGAKREFIEGMWAKNIAKALEARDKREMASRPITIVQQTMNLPKEPDGSDGDTA